MPTARERVARPASSLRCGRGRPDTPVAPAWGRDVDQRPGVAGSAPQRLSAGSRVDRRRGARRRGCGDTWTMMPATWKHRPATEPSKKSAAESWLILITCGRGEVVPCTTRSRMDRSVGEQRAAVAIRSTERGFERRDASSSAGVRSTSMRNCRRSTQRAPLPRSSSGWISESSTRPSRHAKASRVHRRSIRRSCSRCGSSRRARARAALVRSRG